MSRLARAEVHVEASLKTTLFFLRNILGEVAAFPSKSNISIKEVEKTLTEIQNFFSEKLQRVADSG